MLDAVKIIAGTTHTDFAKSICKQLNVPLTDREIIRFNNDNLFVKIKENVREKDVFYIQTTVPPINSALMEAFITIHALKHASAKRITVVMPYYAYSRSDKKDQPRIAITAKLLAQLLETSGANRILTMDLHSPQIQGFFDIPCDQLLANATICSYLKDNYDLTNCVLAAADVGESKHLGVYANALSLPMVIIDKRRVDNTDQVISKHLIGDVDQKHAIIIDDESASGSTLVNAASFLKKRGAKSVRAAIVHPVLEGSAIEKINISEIEEILVTDTIPLGDKANRCKKIKQLTVAPLFAQAIQSIYSGKSLNALFY